MNGVREAVAYGNRSMQNDNVFALPPDLLKLFTLGGREMCDEDCLYLNVWSSGTSGAKRPVLFWCHGGAFITGSGSSPWSDGANLCRTDDVVVVSFNHRLGTLGYLHLEDIAGDDFEGGETDFPKIDVRVRGDVGDMLVFRNVRDNGAFDERMIHAGLPVTSGVKWMASRWIRGTDYLKG